MLELTEVDSYESLVTSWTYFRSSDADAVPRDLGTLAVVSCFGFIYRGGNGFISKDVEPEMLRQQTNASITSFRWAIK